MRSSTCVKCGQRFIVEDGEWAPSLCYPCHRAWASHTLLDMSPGLDLTMTPEDFERHSEACAAGLQKYMLESDERVRSKKWVDALVARVVGGRE